MTRIASISSRIFIEPISAVNADPDRPATMIASEQDAEFTQNEDAHEIDDKARRAEALQLKDALLRDDGADEERDQRDDRHTLERDLFELVDDRRATETGVDEGQAGPSPSGLRRETTRRSGYRARSRP